MNLDILIFIGINGLVLALIAKEIISRRRRQKFVTNWFEKKPLILKAIGEFIFSCQECGNDFTSADSNLEIQDCLCPKCSVNLLNSMRPD